MPHYDGYGYIYTSDSSSEDDDNDNDDDDDGNYFIECGHCNAKVLQRNYGRHLENVHMCRYCKNYMPKNALEGHIQRKHMVTCYLCGIEKLTDEIEAHKETHFKNCIHCSNSIYESDMTAHIEQNHSFAAIIGMVQMHKITDKRFNELVAANRIYSKNGHLFIKS